MKSIVFLVLFFIAIRVNAKYIQTCIVKYKTEEGWSKQYEVNVTFLSGSELNDAIESYKYVYYSDQDEDEWNICVSSFCY